MKKKQSQIIDNKNNYFQKEQRKTFVSSFNSVTALLQPVNVAMHLK